MIMTQVTGGRDVTTLSTSRTDDVTTDDYNNTAARPARAFDRLSSYLSVNH